MSKITDSASLVDRFIKPFFQHLAYPKGYDKVLMVLGAQRSGTTLLSYLLSRQWDTKVFGEFSDLSSHHPVNDVRLGPITRVNAILSNVHARNVIMKPLVESYQCIRLLDEIKNSSGIWQYRHYHDVAVSDNKHFPDSSGLPNLQPILDGETKNWRAAGLSEKVIETVRYFCSLPLSKYEFACLFWWTRNTLYFTTGADNDERVGLLGYPALLKNPQSALAAAQSFAGIQSKGSDKNVGLIVYDTKAGVDDKQPINDELRTLCDDMYARLCGHDSNIISLP